MLSRHGLSQARRKVLVRGADGFRKFHGTRRIACKCRPLEAGSPSQITVFGLQFSNWDSRHPGGAATDWDSRRTSRRLEGGSPSQITVFGLPSSDWDSRHPGGGISPRRLEGGSPSQITVFGLPSSDWDSRHLGGGISPRRLEGGSPSQIHLTTHLTISTVPWGGPI